MENWCRRFLLKHKIDIGYREYDMEFGYGSKLAAPTSFLDLFLKVYERALCRC